MLELRILKTTGPPSSSARAYDDVVTFNSLLAAALVSHSVKDGVVG